MTTSTTPVVLDTRIRDVQPYKGDDWAQSLSKSMATPLFAMGVMSVLAAVATGIAGGVNTGRFFAAFTHPDLANLGRSQILGEWTGALAFLGMGLILGGVVMHLVNIVRTLRDAGRDVQASLGAQPLKLRKPWTGHLTPHVMLMGVMAEIGAFVAGLVAVGYIGGINPAAIANPATASRGDLADIGVANAFNAWLPGLRFAGLAILLTAVVLTLVTIQKTLRFQAARVTEIAERASASKPQATPTPAVDLTGPRPIATGPSARPLAASNRRAGTPKSA